MIINSNKVLFIGMLAVIVSCKKGSEDPLLPFSTRKSRLTGEWEMTNIVKVRDQNGTQEILASSNGDIESIDFITQAGVQENHHSEIKNYSLSMNKNGTWTCEISKNTTVTEYNFDSNTKFNYDYYEIQTGDWSFLGKVKDEYKNNERLVLNVIEDSSWRGEGYKIKEYHNSSPNDTVSFETEFSSVVSYHSGEKALVYALVMLKNKEMKWLSQSENYTTEHSSIGSLEYYSRGWTTINWKIK